MRLEVRVNTAVVTAKLRRLAKEFGDTNEQAIARLAVSCARNLAFETEPWGKKGTKAIQEASILQGIKKIVRIVTPAKMEQLKRTRRAHLIQSGQELNQHIESLRAEGGLVPSIPHANLVRVTEATVKKCFTIRRKLAGMAKGGWLGAGIKAAQMQTGGDRIAIGKNYLGYTQKHAHFGSVFFRGGTMSTRYAILKNAVAHTGKRSVLPADKENRAKDQAVYNLERWYRIAIRKRSITV